jgi:hypothetical protein
VARSADPGQITVRIGIVVEAINHERSFDEITETIEPACLVA